MSKVLLLILDGWGISDRDDGNAIHLAATPNFDVLWDDNPHTTIKAAGEAVGLPSGQIGGSMVGHLTLGAGRIVYQDLTRVNQAIETGELENNPILKEGIEHAKKHDSSMHIKGLVSPGGVHSHSDHLVKLIEIAKNNGLKKVYIHVFTDGRDVAPKSALEYVRELEEICEKGGCAQIASVAGRYWAMDRDQNLDRTEKAFKVLAHCEGGKCKKASEAIEESYKKDITDEFIEPTVILDYQGKTHPVAENDLVVFFNFRPDRARQLTQSMMEYGKNKNLYFITFAEYAPDLETKVLFSPQAVDNTLAQVLADKSKKQVHIAETEKYAHVTYFFNGGKNVKYDQEEHILIPSARDVATHDKKPEMQAKQIRDTVLFKMKENYDFILANFANPDMIGHSGNLEATVKSIEVLDEALGKLIEEANERGYDLIVTADHGNAEMLLHDVEDEKHTAHTLNQVPFILVSKKAKELKETGGLQDVAPTVLELMDIDKPGEMTGESLISNI